MIGYFSYSLHEHPTDEAKPKAPPRAPGVVSLSAPLAESYGIRMTRAVRVEWRERQTVYGRVVANPQASIDIRAPFAGMVKPAAEKPWPKLGDRIDGNQPLVLLEARLTVPERIDLQTKSAEARGKYEGAKEAVRIQELRVEKLKAAAAVPQSEKDAAELELFRARTERDVALQQWGLYQNVVASADGKSVAATLKAPLAGEVADVAAQPGLSVEAGQVLFRVVDFRRVLLRLEFPLAIAQQPAPSDVLVAAADLEASSVAARFTGSAPQVDAASQRLLLYYVVDVPSGAAWRPGLSVKASFSDPSAQPRAAISVPASALLYHQGRSLVYVQLQPKEFERREVDILSHDGDRAILAITDRPGASVRAGWQVVYQQAQVLLSAEFRRDSDDDD